MKNQRSDQLLRDDFTALKMPDEPNLTFDPHRIGKGPTRRVPMTRRNVPYLLIAGALLLGFILMPALVVHPPNPATVHPKEKPGSRLPWRPLGLMFWDMVSANDGWGMTMTGQPYMTASSGRYWRPMGKALVGEGKGGPTVERLFGSKTGVFLELSQKGNQAIVNVSRTSNRGRSWQYSRFTIPGGQVSYRMKSYSVFTADLSTSWSNREDGSILVASGTPRSSGGIENVKLYATRDGGRHWQQVTSRNRIPGDGTLVMENERNWWMVYQGHLWHFSRTTRDWRIVSLEGTVVTAPYFFGGGKRGVVVTHTLKGLTVWSTRRGGGIWDPIGDISGISQGSLYVLNARQWWFWSTSRAASKSTGSLWETENGGRTWTSQGRPLGLPKGFLPDSSVNFVSAEVGYIEVFRSAVPGYFRTTNGGRTWYAVHPEARLRLSQLVDVNGVMLGE